MKNQKRQKPFPQITPTLFYNKKNQPNSPIKVVFLRINIFSTPSTSIWRFKNNVPPYFRGEDTMGSKMEFFWVNRHFNSSLSSANPISGKSTSYRSKWSRPIRLQDFWSSIFLKVMHQFTWFFKERYKPRKGRLLFFVGCVQAFINAQACLCSLQGICSSKII